ncbi:thiamine diphosphokinase [Waddlia chondrophila]|uniref:thiamine diphosphokinase n=1 Tax=Waddlia chondrophila TaxID=71667 RepID=UPI0009AE84A1|nr:thiamine diphosphokinase [Waddlia chondrophila]
MDVRVILAAIYLGKIQEPMTPRFTAPVALVANGPIGSGEVLKNQLARFKTIIAVDGGLHTCHKLGVRPNFIIGDMDSAGSELLASYPEIPKKTFSPEKDQTDLELAILEIKKQKINRATLFCALKMRTDHSLYNLHLLSRYKEILTIETDYETLFFVEGNCSIPCTPGQTVSLLPLGIPAKGVVSKGLKWELENATLNGTFASISNICLGDAFSLSIKEGELLCFLIK